MFSEYLFQNFSQNKILQLFVTFETASTGLPLLNPPLKNRVGNNRATTRDCPYYESFILK